MDNFGNLEDGRNREPTDNVVTDQKMPTPKKFLFTRSWADMENNDGNSSSIYDISERQKKFRAKTPGGVVEKLQKAGLFTWAKPKDIEFALDESKNPSSNNRMVHMIRIKEMSPLTS